MYLSQNSLICWTRVVQNYWLLDPSQIIHFSLPFIFCFFKKRGKKRKKREVHWDQGKANKLPMGQEKMEPCLKTTKATRSIVFFHLFYNLQFISYRFVFFFTGRFYNGDSITSCWQTGQYFSTLRLLVN